MAPQFGTSGLRGLVSELTGALVADHLRAFIAACPMGSGLWVGRDLRPSSPDLAPCVLETARAEGLACVDCGAVPTPALALAAMQAGAAAVMVTGSQIPADRNGLKFYLPDGEITKADEAAILAALGGRLRAGLRGRPRAPRMRQVRLGSRAMSPPSAPGRWPVCGWASGAFRRQPRSIDAGGGGFGRAGGGAWPLRPVYPRRY
ncbi:hypothetical protein MASR2M74_07090 [Paracoccaceae bacterium]